jgi:hypothetical protein
MDEILKPYVDIALSDKQLLDLVKNKANVILYPNLKDYKNIEDVLGKNRAAFILFCSTYTPTKRYGHWCLVHQIGPHTLEFFNSYGGKNGFPDDSLNYIPMDTRKRSNQFHTKLSELMEKSPYELTYNEIPFQRHSKDVKTCGRHCGARLLLKEMDLYEYENFLNLLAKELGLDYDEIVTLLTLELSKK